MDLVKELIDLKNAIKDALEDGRVTPLEMAKIVKEAADVILAIAPIIFGTANLKEKEHTN